MDKTIKVNLQEVWAEKEDSLLLKQNTQVDKTLIIITVIFFKFHVGDLAIETKQTK